jgi:hypothetical protein
MLSASYHFAMAAMIAHFIKISFLGWLCLFKRRR